MVPRRRQRARTDSIVRLPDFPMLSRIFVSRAAVALAQKARHCTCIRPRQYRRRTTTAAAAAAINPTTKSGIQTDTATATKRRYEDVFVIDWLYKKGIIVGDTATPNGRTNRPVAVHRWVGRSVDWSVDWLGGWLAGWLHGWLAGWSVGMVGLLVGSLGGWMNGELVGVGWPCIRIIGPQSAPFGVLQKKRETIPACLLKRSCFRVGC